MPRRKKEEQPREQIKTIKTPSLARGMKDFLPADEKYYDYLENEIGRLVRDYSFKRIITPVLERYELFNHTLYKQFGAFERDAIYFVDHGEKVCLRPEMMSAICRSYIEHNMAVQPLPIKLYYIAPVFRQGRGDAGKQRQFLQAGFAIIGDKAPAIDAELIIISHFLLKNVGLSAEVKLNSLGCPICRPGYKKALQEYLRFKRNMVPAELRKIVAKEPLKVFTCSGQKCQKLIEDAPQVVDYLCDDCRAHLFKVLEYLDELQVAYKLDPAFSPEFD